jgi:N-acetylglucosaminyldiphosphoundecaprenol N-acetyl-beta-D-mannosaminyltransferase
LTAALTILGCRVDVIDARDAVERIAAFARGASPALVVTLGTEMIVRAQRDARFRQVVNGSSLSLCDTIGVVLAARLQGVRIAERVTGVDLIDPLCERLAREGLTVFLLGGKGETARTVAKILQQRHPGLLVAGTHDGYFSAFQEGELASEIARSAANVLFVGLGSPRQEVWLADHLKETGCAVGIGVGGSFDVLAGNVARAPAQWRRLNLEWLYRLVREPSRWRRQLALPYFVWLAVCERALDARARRLS